jgi:hypothetical protein
MAPGPIPKRSEERRRRNKDNPIDMVAVIGKVKPAPCPVGLHPQARSWYRSFTASGMAKYYESTDWQQLRVLAIILSKLLASPRVSAQLFAAWASAVSELGPTEGSRRRMHIEIQRSKSSAEPVSNIEAYRRAKSG